MSKMKFYILFRYWINFLNRILERMNFFKFKQRNKKDEKALNEIEPLLDFNETEKSIISNQINQILKVNSDFKGKHFEII